MATQIFFISNPKIGEDSHFAQYFSKGLKPPTRSDLFLNPKNLRVFRRQIFRGFYDPVGGKVLVNGEDGWLYYGMVGGAPATVK